ncbi:hypothetical protein HBI56_082010 [Parastagonospora nodorum]|nr:hypothetical protein HBH53_059850 [Parastagonospora nodorum]KAH3975691.1 hypothetical protein HBH52_127000 [Parastagonospora nodorum]KAH3978670.1 hypothetical protein HBH51_063920 [Parastagonospora nodorum]KAH4032392.1 hypothetical protein HBI09_118260 [Parastagonospora nodorum]KAH4049342.1 hypothetical protein HBH49_145420 [Parastagonospora nodorum]
MNDAAPKQALHKSSSSSSIIQLRLIHRPLLIMLVLSPGAAITVPSHIYPRVQRLPP